MLWESGLGCPCLYWIRKVSAIIVSGDRSKPTKDFRVYIEIRDEYIFQVDLPTWRKGIEFEELNPNLPEDESKLCKMDSYSSSEAELWNEALDRADTEEYKPETENDEKWDWPISPVKKWNRRIFSM